MRRVSQFLFAPAAVAALTALPLTLTSGVAQAATSECAATEVCVFPQPNYAGGATTVMDEVCHTTAVGSVVEGDSEPGQEMRVFAQPGCSGTPVVVTAGTNNPNLSGKSYIYFHQPGA
jgi:hypothetical protein